MKRQKKNRRGETRRIEWKHHWHTRHWIFPLKKKKRDGNSVIDHDFSVQTFPRNFPIFSHWIQISVCVCFFCFKLILQSKESISSIEIEKIEISFVIKCLFICFEIQKKAFFKFEILLFEMKVSKFSFSKWKFQNSPLRNTSSYIQISMKNGRGKRELFKNFQILIVCGNKNFPRLSTTRSKMKEKNVKKNRGFWAEKSGNPRAIPGGHVTPVCHLVNVTSLFLPPLFSQTRKRLLFLKLPLLLPDFLWKLVKISSFLLTRNFQIKRH